MLPALRANGDLQVRATPVVVTRPGPVPRDHQKPHQPEFDVEISFASRVIGIRGITVDRTRGPLHARQSIRAVNLIDPSHIARQSARIDNGHPGFDADAYPALQIVQVQVLSGGDCTVPSVPTSMHRSSGTLDLALQDGSAPAYYLPVAIANNLEASGSTPATEMNNLTFTHFTVELSAPNVEWPSTCPATFDTQTVTDVLAPRTTAGVSLDVITPSHARCLLPYVTTAPLLVTVTITAKGRHGGTSIASPPFVYSIEVCTGCLQQGYSDPAFKPYQYPAAPPLCSALTGVNPYTGDPCLPPGQDAQILCCALPSTTGGMPHDLAVCPAVFIGTASTGTSASSSR